MKAIIIRSVSNGWIVEERWASDPGVGRELAVFNHMSDLQAALPSFFEEKPLDITTTQTP